MIAIDAHDPGARRPEQERIELTGERRPVRGEQVARGIADRAGADRVGQEVKGGGCGRRCGWPHGDQRVVLDARDRQPAGDETVVVTCGSCLERVQHVFRKELGDVGVAEAVDRQQRRAGRLRRPCARSSGQRRSTCGRGRRRQRPSRWRRPAPLRVRGPARNRAQRRGSTREAAGSAAPPAARSRSSSRRSRPSQQMLNAPRVEARHAAHDEGPRRMAIAGFP